MAQASMVRAQASALSSSFWGSWYGRTDSPCVLQDFIPLRGRSPAYLKGYHKQTAQQGKGTEDHFLPLGDWLDETHVGHSIESVDIILTL